MVPLGDIHIELPRLGELGLRLWMLGADDMRSRIVAARPESVPMGLECHDLSGLLLVENSLAASLVDAVLEAPSSLVAEPLSRIERGILNAVVATLLSRLGFSAGLRLDEGTTPDVSAWTNGIAVAVESSHAHGWSYLCGSPEFLRAAWTSRLPAPTGSDASLRLQIACTDVLSPDLDSAEVRDLVMFDGQAPLAPAEPWRISVFYRGLKLPAQLDPDGSLRLLEVVGDAKGDEPAHETLERAPLNARAGAGREDEDGRTQIRAELGALEPGRLADLVCGGIRGIDRNGPVLLRVRETPWAEGEIVGASGSLAGSLAVRIRRKLGG